MKNLNLLWSKWASRDHLRTCHMEVIATPKPGGKFDYHIRLICWMLDGEKRCRVISIAAGKTFMAALANADAEMIRRAVCDALGEPAVLPGEVCGSDKAPAFGFGEESTGQPTGSAGPVPPMPVPPTENTDER